MKQYISEIRDFHPLVAQWLTDNGYEYIHEYIDMSKREYEWMAVAYKAMEIMNHQNEQIERLFALLEDETKGE